MQKKYLALAALSIMLLNPLQASAEGKDGVAAVVNGQKITVAEIREAYDSNPALKSKIPFKDFYDKAIDVYVNGSLLYQAAVKDNVPASPEYKKQLKLAQEELTRKIYLEKAVDKMITKDDINKVYNDYKARFKPETEIKAKHILVPTEAQAKEVIAKLNKGGNFDKLAKENSKDKAELGYFTKEVMVPEFADAAFKMKKGTYSKTPVKTQFGYHVIMVEDIRDSKPMPLKELEPQIKAKLTNDAIAKVFQDVSKGSKVEKYGLDGKVIK